MINENLINNINIKLNPYTVNGNNTNTEYDITPILNSNLFFATPNNDATPYSPITAQTLLKDNETPSTKRIPNFTIDFITTTKKTVENAETNSSEKYIDTIYERFITQNFKDNILQNLHYNIKEIFNSEFMTFKSKCEELAKKSSIRSKKQIDHWQNELKTKEKIIDQILKSLNNLNNSELKSKNNIIHKLIDQTNGKEKIRRQSCINVKYDTAKNKSNKKIVTIVPRKLKNTLKKLNQIIYQIKLNPRM